MSKEAMKLALEALAVKFSKGWHEGIKIDASDIMLLNDAAQALAEQPAQQEYTSFAEWANDYVRANLHKLKPAQQEPVARQYQNRDGVWKDFISEKHYKATLEDGSWPIRNLYTSPPAQRTWVGLTTEDMATCINEPAWDLVLRKAEQILKEKNT